MSSFRICDGLELVIDCAVPESVVEQAAEGRKALVGKAYQRRVKGLGVRVRMPDKRNSGCRVVCKIFGH